MLQDLDDAMDLDSEQKRHDWQDLAEVARPQRGVVDLKGAFPNAEPPPQGVRDAGDSAEGMEQQ